MHRAGNDANVNLRVISHQFYIRYGVGVFNAQVHYPFAIGYVGQPRRRKCSGCIYSFQFKGLNLNKFNHSATQTHLCPHKPHRLLAGSGSSLRSLNMTSTCKPSCESLQSLLSHQFGRVGGSRFWRCRSIHRRKFLTAHQLSSLIYRRLIGAHQHWCSCPCPTIKRLL